MLHVVRLFGADYRGATHTGDTKQGPSFLQVLLNCDTSRAAFGGEPTLIDTRDGVRCRVINYASDDRQPAREAHSDQLLAVLGELGIPLSESITTAGGRRSVRQLLDDSTANFDLRQPEIEWSALAYGLYLPPERIWRDKFGEWHTFDELVHELIRRPYRQACSGTHLLYSLTILLRVDATSAILSPAAREAAITHLGRTAEALRYCQFPEGSWPADWDQFQQTMPAPPNRGEHWRQVLVTGHHLEWLLRLPDDLRPGDDCLLRAAQWLLIHLEQDDRQLLEQYYCPYSHAGSVLAQLTGREATRRGPDHQLARSSLPGASSAKGASAVVNVESLDAPVASGQP